MISGDRSIFPEHEGQLRGEPVRSLAIKCSACAGLYVAGRGLRMTSSKNCILDLYAKTADLGKLTALGCISKLLHPSRHGAVDAAPRHTERAYAQSSSDRATRVDGVPLEHSNRI